MPNPIRIAINDYADMAAHLAAGAQAREVVNFSPVLLEKIDDYARQITAHLETDAPPRDPVLAALAAPVFALEPTARLKIVDRAGR